MAIQFSNGHVYALTILHAHAVYDVIKAIDIWGRKPKTTQNLTTIDTEPTPNMVRHLASTSNAVGREHYTLI